MEWCIEIPYLLLPHSITFCSYTSTAHSHNTDIHPSTSINPPCTASLPRVKRNRNSRALRGSRRGGRGRTGPVAEARVQGGSGENVHAADGVPAHPRANQSRGSGTLR